MVRGADPGTIALTLNGVVLQIVYHGPRPKVVYDRTPTRIKR